MKLFELTYVVTFNSTDFEDKVLIPASSDAEAKSMFLELTSKSSGIFSMQVFPGHKTLLPLKDKGRLKITRAVELPLKLASKKSKKGEE